MLLLDRVKNKRRKLSLLKKQKVMIQIEKLMGMEVQKQRRNKLRKKKQNNSQQMVQ